MNITHEGLGAIVCCLAAPFVVPAVAFWFGAERTQEAWSSVIFEPTVNAAARPYRWPAPREPLATGRPPGVVLAAAFMSYFLGQMFVPGLACGIIGLYYFGLGLVSIPGLYLAWRIFGLGTALLHRAPDAPQRADRAAKFAFVLNAPVLAVGALYTYFNLPELGIFLVGYALVSIAHGVLLKKAAAVLRAADLGDVDGVAFDGAAGRRHALEPGSLLRARNVGVGRVGRPPEVKRPFRRPRGAWRPGAY